MKRSKKQKRGKSVPAERFVKVWQRSRSAIEVARKLGYSFQQARNRASSLRAKGVRLKKFKRYCFRLNITKLNRIAVRELRRVG